MENLLTLVDSANSVLWNVILIVLLCGTGIYYTIRLKFIHGHARPSLSKPADQITLLDIYKAVEGEKPLLHLDTHTNPDCGVGINIQLSLQEFYNEIQKATEEKMNTITLQDIINTYYQRTSMQID